MGLSKKEIYSSLMICFFFGLFWVGFFCISFIFDKLLIFYAAYLIFGFISAIRALTNENILDFWTGIAVFLFSFFLWFPVYCWALCMILIKFIKYVKNGGLKKSSE